MKGLHITYLESEWSCPHCGKNHAAEDWEGRARELRIGYRVTCLGCARKVDLMYTITGKIVSLKTERQ